MAFISLASKTWGSSPDITLTPSYEKQRSGANMQYRIKMVVGTCSGSSYFGYPIYMKTSLDGSLKDTHTLKSASPKQWSSAITYTTDWFTISNKTTGTVTLSLNVYSGSGSSRNKTYTYSLAVDPAASVLGTISNFTIGNAISIPITNYGLSDTLAISVGGTTIKTLTTVYNGMSVSFTDSELATIYSKIPSATTATFTFTNTTKSGSTTVGTSTKTATGTIPSSIKPSISSVTVSEANTNVVPSSWGVYVKNKSKLKFVVSASAGSGSSISSVKTTINGTPYTGSTITTNLITASGNLTATIQVTDKRGRSISTTETVTILDYADPYVTTLNAFRCDVDGNMNDKGSYIYVHLKGGVYSLSGKNTPISYAVQWKKVTEADSAYQTYTFDVTDTTIDSYVILEDIATGSSYNVRVVLTDYFGNIYRSATPISSVFRTLNFKPGGHAIGVGKIAEDDNLFDVGLKSRFSGGILQPILEPETDLNNVLIPNIYTGENVSTYNYANAPVSNGTFTLTVKESGPVGQLKQILELCDKTKSTTWERFYYGGTWGEWVKTSDWTLL